LIHINDRREKDLHPTAMPLTASSLSPAAVAEHLVAAFRDAERRTVPFFHLLLRDCLPEPLRAAFAAFDAPLPAQDGSGRRETANAQRLFIDPALAARWPAADALRRALIEPEVVETLGTVSGARLAGTSLRIEYCQDTDGFWLEPHTDIPVKRLTFLIYLSEEGGREEWGTDLYDGAGQHAGRAPADPNRGLVFVPGADTWHGFEKRPIRGVRRSLIINYVGPEWRARHELAWPSPLLP
jgi:hypothetical protein